MKATALLYHDVVADPARHEESGFSGQGAALYKLTRTDFEKHAAAIHQAAHTPPSRVIDWQNESGISNRLFLTFDDGGASAHAFIAAVLQRYQWRAHFFVTADFIGAPGFLSLKQILELHRAGHVIGSHSCSHPPRMSACSREQLFDEWQRSAKVLSEIIGEPVISGSVPGGHYSRQVARMAGQAGIKFLFSSEPSRSPWQVDNCLVFGRYSIQRNTPPEIAARLAAGDAGPRISQFIQWNSKKIAKSLGGSGYLRLRELLLRQR